MTNIQTLLITHIAALIIGFVAALFIIGGGAQSSKQDANYDQKLDNIANSVVELKNVMMTNNQQLNGLINFNRTIVKDNPRLKISGLELFDEPETEPENERRQEQ